MAGAGIITFLHNNNFGSTLQAYALQRTIRELGMECLHLDYAPDREEKIRNLLVSGNSPRLILDGIRKREVLAGQHGAALKSQAIPAFYAEHMKLSTSCRNQKELREAARNCDLLVCGSDQVWNPVWLNSAYFLTFADRKQPKIAYAVSLGISTLPKAAKIRKIRRWTEEFRAISVREQEGADLLEEMTGRKAEVMPDPVCLLTAEEWSGIAGSAPEGDPYLLCYFIGDDPTYWARVKALQMETGLRVLVLPVTAESYRSGYELLDGAGPEMFLSAVRNAKYFLTDSFHGLVFGTVFGTETEAFRRYKDDDPESKNSRVDHFLRLTAEKGIGEIRETGRNWLRENLKINS